MPDKILIIGTDINAYSMARCYHELYGKKADIIGKAEMKFTSLSSITNITYEPNLWDKEVFKKTLQAYGEKQQHKILLIGTNDFYVRLIAENEGFLKQWYVFNYPRLELVDSFLKKDSFYEKYSDKLDIPKTFIYSCTEKTFPVNFMYPMIVKPGDGVSYYKHKFEGQSKVYKIKSEEELKKVIGQIEKSGYKETLILQEFIPGNDTALFDSMFYVGSDGKARLASFAQIGLQEHTSTGVGNCTVLVNGFGEHGIPTELIYKLKSFLEDIGYTGFAEFDLKYDVRDGKYKIFEINPRQARCSYYLTACGFNLVQSLTEDIIKKKEQDFQIITEKQVYSFVPKSIIYKNVENEILLKEIKTLIQQKGYSNGLKYKGDKSFLRKVYLFLRDINFTKKYKEKNWW